MLGKIQNIPSDLGVEPTSETSLPQAEFFVAGGRRMIMDGETNVYSLFNWVNSQDHKDQMPMSWCVTTLDTF